jgi:hypothetical protein
MGDGLRTTVQPAAKAGATYRVRAEEQVAAVFWVSINFGSTRVRVEMSSKRVMFDTFRCQTNECFAQQTLNTPHSRVQSEGAKGKYDRALLTACISG